MTRLINAAYAASTLGVDKAGQIVPLRGCFRIMQAATKYESKPVQPETKMSCVRVFEKKTYLHPQDAGSFQTNVLARTDERRYSGRHVVATNLHNLSKLHISK